MKTYRLGPTAPAIGVVTNRFVPVGDGFEVEHAGPIIRIWCGGCDKHGHLSDDDQSTVEGRRRCISVASESHRGTGASMGCGRERH